MLTRSQKQERVGALREKFERANSVIVADYRGLDVPGVNALRKELRTKGAGEYEYEVAKNTLLRLAAEGTAVEVITDRFTGPTAIAISFGDPVGMAKVLVDYAKENEAFEIQGGMVDGNALDEGEIGTLATLPSLDQLRGKIVGLLQAPATKLVRVLSAPGAQVARVVAARKDQLESGGE